MEEYEKLYKRSIEDVDNFWAEMAREYISWYKEWNFVLRYDFEAAEIEWFGGAELNVTYNCLDRRLPKLKNRVAYYWEGDNPAESRTITYQELYEQVNKLAAVLKAQGIRKGDRVIIYMPMILELPVAMLACARIGAIHSVIFAGFSAESIAGRVQDCQAKMVITVDGGYRAGKVLQLKKNVDEALTRRPEVEKIIVFNRANLGLQLDPKKELWWHELMSDPSLPSYVEPERMGSEDPLFILYTSGSTGNPKAWCILKPVICFT